MIRENTIISVIQKKGDIRKTALAFSLARDLGLRYSNNDLLEREKRQHIGFGYEVKPYFVYDLDYENWLDTYAEFVVWNSHYILIPITPNLDSIHHGSKIFSDLICYQMVKRHQIVILFTDTSNQAELDYFTEYSKIGINWSGVNFFVLPKSDIFQNAISCDTSFLVLANENALAKHKYSFFIYQYQKILDFIKNIWQI